MDRAVIAAEVAALSQAERRTLKSLGVRFGAYTLYLPALLRDEALAFTRAFAGVGAPGWALSGRGLRQAGQRTYAILALERLDELLRAANFMVTDAALETLNWPRKEAETILRALGWFTTRKAKDGEPAHWRRRALKPAPTPAPVVNPASPFAALAQITVSPKRRRRPRKKARA
jgi:ATP-dependent RNA helicase SUPV3L1/SUV3